MTKLRGREGEEGAGKDTEREEVDRRMQAKG